MRSKLPLRSYWTKCAATVLLVACTAALRIWPLPVLGSGLALLTFYPAVTVAALYGGLFTGLLSVCLSCFTVLFLWPVLAVAPFIEDQTDWLALAVFILHGAIISAVAQALLRARAGSEIFQTLIQSIDDGFAVIEMIYDLHGKPIDYRFLETNAAFIANTGLCEWRHKTMREMVPNHDPHWYEIYGTVAKTGKDIRYENSATAMQREYDVFAFRIGGDGTNRVGIFFKDISVRKRQEAELVKMARYDALTGLPNRAMFHDYFTKALSRAERGHYRLALLFLDLDGFKAVNDSLGHEVGDLLLRAVAQRLTACVRVGDLVARLGGDEFTIILEDCAPAHLSELADKIIQTVERPFDLDGATATISTSIGIAVYPECATDEKALMLMADSAMYRVKKSGKSGRQFCNQTDCTTRGCDHKA